MIRVQGLETMPKCCGDCHLVRIVPFHHDGTVEPVFKCFWTKEVDVGNCGSRKRMPDCPLIQTDCLMDDIGRIYGKQTTAEAQT